MTDARMLAGEGLLAAFDAARAATTEVAFGLTDEQWRVPRHPSIQPTAWDLAHIGWFATFWVLRGPHRIQPDGTVRADGQAPVFGDDRHLDSACISHPERWQMQLPTRTELRDALATQLDLCKRALTAAADEPTRTYHARFAIYHELMHVEALWWTRALLGYEAPAQLRMARFARRDEVPIDGGEHGLGGPRQGGGFAFDNELPGRRLELAPFRIDAQPVDNGRFLEFVRAGGYGRRAAWTAAGWAWREQQRREHPARWRRCEDGRWQQRWFDRWVDLATDEPVVHVSAHEAEAYCRFAGRRLPTAAEWEVAADRIDWGRSVWEWTADPFVPYPCFQPAPYTTYSAPWFHHQRECRGGAFATHALLHDRRYRNFFVPERTDAFTGFRTAVDA